MTTLLCPLCTQSKFDTLEALRSRLVRAATQNITCPICEDVLLGLDKFTIHLFGHSLPPTEPEVEEEEEEEEIPKTQPSSPVLHSTVNIDDLSFLASWESCCTSQERDIQEKTNPYEELHLEIKVANEKPEIVPSIPGTLSTEPMCGQSTNDLNFESNLLPVPGLDQNQVLSFVNPSIIHDSNEIKSKFFTEPRLPNSPDSPSYAMGDSNFLMTPSPKDNESIEENEVGLGENRELSQYMDGLLRLEAVSLHTELPTQPEEITGNLKRDIKEKILRKYVEVGKCSTLNENNSITEQELIRKPGTTKNSSNKQIENYLQVISQQYPCENLVEIKEKLKNLGIYLYQDEKQKTNNIEQDVLQNKNMVLIHKPFIFQPEEIQGIRKSDELKEPSSVRLERKTSIGEKESLKDGKSEPEVHACRECGKCFRMRGSLIVHTRVAHAGKGLEVLLVPRNFQCQLCPKTFKKEQHLSQHVKTHDGKQWRCEICSKYFTTKYFLKKHQRLHTGEMPYCCETCGKTFTFQQSYHKHLLYHSADKPHECKECGRSFKELSTLHNHERIHSGEKPFACETCGKCFRQRVSYIVHQRIHTGVLPYQCTACFKKFRYKVSQRSHKCPAQPPGVVVRQPGDFIQRLLEQRGILQSNV